MQMQQVRVVANFEPALLAALDAWRRAQRVIPSRAAVIREAVRTLAAQPTFTNEPRGKAPRKTTR